MIEFRTKKDKKGKKIVYPIISGSKKEYRREYTVMPNLPKQSIQRELINKTFVMGLIQPVSMAREIYIGYTVANLIYSSWKTIYNAYKNPDALKQGAYDFFREEAKIGLTNYQTGIIWDYMKDKVPEPLEPLKNRVHNQLTNFISNVTEEEISLVESTLAAF